MAALDAQLAALATLSPAQLREQWVAVVGPVVPRVSPAMLQLALGYELQARAFGGLSRVTQQKLGQLARAKTVSAPVQSGMRLVRAWQGRTHVVIIGEDGVIRWNERDWGSLSEVARGCCQSSANGSLHDAVRSLMLIT
ncbi:MAG: DUF2924 domain-containing protein [Sphingomonadales bacterium]